MGNQSTINYIVQSVKDDALRIFEKKLLKIILFGSYARGDFCSDSDVDIMLLIDDSPEGINKYFDEVIKLSSRLSLENEDCTTVTLLMQDKDTFNNNVAISPFFRNISDEGIIVYAA